MKGFNLRSNLSATIWIGGTILATSALADTPQSGSGMMDGYGTGWMGGYGGIWMPILLVAVAAGLVGWIIAQKKK